MHAINGFGGGYSHYNQYSQYGQFGGQQQSRLNPDSYAQRYAQQNNLSLEEAKEKLKSTYGEPQQPQYSIFDTQSMQNNISSIDMSEFESEDFKSFSFKDLFRQFTDMFKGDGPQKEGDPQIPEIPQSQSITGIEKQAPVNPFETNDTEAKNGNPFGNPDPDMYAQIYADKNNLTLDEAKAELQAKYGDPTQR